MTQADARSGRVRSGRTFEALHVASFRRLWLAGVAQFSAIAMESIARGYLAFELTGRNAALGITLLAMGIPMLLLTPIGGVAADRFAKRTVLVVASGLLLGSSVAVAIAVVTDVLAFWMLVAGSVVQGVAYSLLAPARVAFSYELVGRERLGNAILLAQLAMNGTRVVGPALAGLVLGISWLGADAVYLATVALFAVSFGFTLRLPRGAVREHRPTASPWEELRAGVRYVRREPPVLWPVLMAIGMMATAFPYVAFLPSLVDEVFAEGPGWLGVLSTVSAVGAMGVSLVVARIGTDRLGDGSVAAVAALFAASVVALGLAPSIAVATVGVLVAGAGNAAFQALNNSVVLMRSRDEFHGRVQSLLMLGWSAFGIFAFPLGAVADAIGLRATLVGMGAVSLVIAAALHVQICRSAEAPNRKLRVT
ncbi:MAG: MFS transporter [Acidimicrobiales bacterium]